MIVLTLPASDLAATRRFYTAVGCAVDERFTDEHCVCVAVTPAVYVMAMDRDRFARVVGTEVADPRRTTQVVLSLAMSSREETDAFVAAALANGGSRPASAPPHAGRDGEEVYGVAVTDPDGHLWELLYPSAPVA